MNNPKTVLLSLAAFATGIAPLAAFRASIIQHEIVAGTSAILFVFATKALNRAILAESASKKMKATRDFIETFGVFSVISAGLLAEVIPVQLGVATLMLLGVTKLYMMQLSKRFRQSFDFKIGETMWLTLTALIYLLSSSNTYFLFWGYFLLSLVILYDLTGLFRDVVDQPRV